MHKHQLSMRKAHGESGTFFVGVSENFKFRDMHKRPMHSLNFAIHNTHRLVQVII